MTNALDTAQATLLDPAEGYRQWVVLEMRIDARTGPGDREVLVIAGDDAFQKDEFRTVVVDPKAVRGQLRERDRIDHDDAQ